MTGLTQEEIRRAKGALDEIIGEVCGACALNCCWQGTMVGSDDSRRIAKAARLSAAFRIRLTDGLARRSGELRSDADGLEATARLLRARFADEKPSELAQLDEALAAWRGFCDFLDRDFAAAPEDLLRCLLFSALRAKALRAMRAFPGGEKVLPALVGSKTSFRPGRRGVKADRCLFHVGGCLVASAKPHKCEDFYCGSDPGLVHEVVDRMTFDDFTLAHIIPYRRNDLLRDLTTEVEMGRDYCEPKIIVGADASLLDATTALLATSFDPVTVTLLEGQHFDATVDLPDPTRLPPGEALVVRCGSIDALGVYELAVLLVRARGASARPAVLLLADEFRRCAGAIHPLWRSRAMSQPLSAANLWGVVE